uniref:ParB-like N-terminal domain-containing protein n=1 Tax=Curvibacter symbiont subsp. Hydra magnipapillata TaxID=667019 RepID=C9Y6S1_CURXX|nr:hypothetical protein Csp_E36480 [Curvibacter putative symbiont of Hydra magnipapillata]
MTLQIATIANFTEIPQSRASAYVPLNKLVLAKEQVRSTPISEQNLTEIAEILLAQGQLNALQVSRNCETGLYSVKDDGLRLRGLQKLVSDGKIMPDFPIECIEVDDENATVFGFTKNTC